MVSGTGSAPATKRPGSGARAPAKPAASRTAAASRAWVPERQDVIWIDCNPQAGGEMRDMHPMLVLSPGAFNARTGLVIGLPMTTAAYNATNPFALAVGAAGARKTGKTSYVLCHQPKSFDWRARLAKPHPQGQLADAAFSQACAVLNQVISIE
jgi:mRNA interferase MazF